jgi:hypothetical protein
MVQANPGLRPGLSSAVPPGLKRGVALLCGAVADGSVDRQMLPVATCFRSLPVLSNLFNKQLCIGLVAAPKGQHSHVVEIWGAVGKRPQVVKAGVDQLGRLPRSLLMHQGHHAIHAVLTTLVAGF